MAVTVEGGLQSAQNGIDRVLDAPKKLVEGDVEGALKAGFHGQQEVKRGLLKTAAGLVAAPFRLLTGNTERGSNAARNGTQASLEKHV